MDDPCYYRILYWKSKNLITIVEMQSFDEYDYNQNHFLRDDNGEAMKFDREEDAILFLNQNFKAEKIDPEYLSPNNKDFWK